jgi:hypothetical protein
MTINPVARDLQARVRSSLCLLPLSSQDASRTVDGQASVACLVVRHTAITARQHAASSWLDCFVDSDVVDHVPFEWRLDRQYAFNHQQDLYVLRRISLLRGSGG